MAGDGVTVTAGVVFARAVTVTVCDPVAPMYAAELAESGAGDEVIRSIAGHVSRAMLSRYSHVRMEAKRRALDKIAARQRLADEKRNQEIERQRLAQMAPETLAIQ